MAVVILAFAGCGGKPVNVSSTNSNTHIVAMRIVTDDLRPDRINLVVADGTITMVSFY